MTGAGLLLRVIRGHVPVRGAIRSRILRRTPPMHQVSLRKTCRAACEQRAQRIGRERTREVVSLSARTTQFTEMGELLDGLDTLCSDAELEIVGHGHDGAHDSRVLGI